MRILPMQVLVVFVTAGDSSLRSFMDNITNTCQVKSNREREREGGGGRVCVNNSSSTATLSTTYLGRLGRAMQEVHNN